MDAVVAAQITNNIITGNAGGGIGMINDVSATAIVQNLISGNTASVGSGVYWSNSPAFFVNITIIDSSVAGGITVTADGFGSWTTVANNIIVAIQGATNALSCTYTDLTASNFITMTHSVRMDLPMAGCVQARLESTEISRPVRSSWEPAIFV